MTFQNRREFLFIYSVKDANPNGDPLNANQPRFDPESGQILVSDVRIKRTMRDEWLRQGMEVFVDGEPKTLANRIDEIKKAHKVDKAREALAKCIDTRLFGVTFAQEKDSFSWTGPVQFKWGRSLHKAKSELVQGTGAFTTKEGNDQRTFRNEYIVPFVVLGVYGIANQNSSEKTGATDNDLDHIHSGLWQGSLNLITRSKIGHQPRLLLEIKYQKDYQGLMGSLDELVCLEKDGKPLNEEEQLSLRSLKDVQINLSALAKRLEIHQAHLEKITLIKEKGLQVTGAELLGKLLKTEER